MNKLFIRWTNLLFVVILLTGCNSQKAPVSDPVVVDDTLKAKHYYSGFENAYDTYNAISPASNGKIYYVLSSKEIDDAGKVYVYDPRTDQTKFLADLTDICGEKGQKVIHQGKCHTDFYESDGKLYFATHVGYFEVIDGVDQVPVNLPGGFKPYPGGHILSYDLKSEKFEELAIAPHGEGIITMTMDTERGQIYGITAPKGYFIHYDTNKKLLKNLGQVSGNGEAGIPGKDFRVLCRSMFVTPDDGSVYFSTAEGDILFYNPDSGSVKKVEGVSLILDYFGKYDPTKPGSMSYNWRSIFWYAPEGVAYGVHGNSGYLFRFDPRTPKLELVERITSEPSKKSGMFDQFVYGYLGFELGPDRETIYYLTGGPFPINGQIISEENTVVGARGLENLHLVTFNIPGKKYTDHGPIYYEDGGMPTWVNSIAMDNDGNVYTLARFENNGKVISDLVKIPNPFLNKH